MEGKDKDIIELFNRKQVHYKYYPGESVCFKFQGIDYTNQLVYRINQGDLPKDLRCELYQCLKNAFYVGRKYDAIIIEGVIIIFNDNEFSVESHCWNKSQEDGTYFDITPFKVEPQDIIYIPYKTFKKKDYQDKFGNDTKKYTFLSGQAIFKFEEVIKTSLKKDEKSNNIGEGEKVDNNL